MNPFKKHPSSQTTIEMAAIAVFVLVAMTVMGPYLVRSINAYMRSWELSADLGQSGVNVEGLPGIPEPPPPECSEFECYDFTSQGIDFCQQDTYGCCLWVEKYIDVDGECYHEEDPTLSGDGCENKLEATKSECPNVPTIPISGSGLCCGGPDGLDPEPDMTPIFCQDMWECVPPPNECEFCDDGVCDNNCHDGYESCNCPDCMPDSPHYGYDPNEPPDPPEDSSGCEPYDDYCFWKEESGECCEDLHDCDPCNAINCSGLSFESCYYQSQQPTQCCNWVVLCTSTPEECTCGVGVSNGYCHKQGCPDGWHPGGICNSCGCQWANPYGTWFQNCCESLPAPSICGDGSMWGPN